MLAAQLNTGTQMQLSGLGIVQTVDAIVETTFMFMVPKIAASFKYFMIIKVIIIIRNLEDKGKERK